MRDKRSVVAEIDLIYKNHVKPSMRPQVLIAKDAYEIFIETWDENKIELIEQSKIMLLNRTKHVLGVCTLSSGGTTGTIVDMKLLFAVAIKSNASSLILAHNHPSGNLKPSVFDINLTKRIISAGQILDIEVLDHLIISNEGFFSFSSEGII